MSLPDDTSPPAQKPANQRSIFDTSTLAIALASLGCAIGVYYRDGAQKVVEVFHHSSWLLIDVLPRMAAGSMIGAFIGYVIPREHIARTLGKESGFWGLLIGTVFGALIPGGPFTIYPIASALLFAGADAGAIIAFVTSWTLLGYARALVWEMPFMGPDFTFWRIVICLPLPIIVGWLGRVVVRVFPSFGAGR